MNKEPITISGLEKLKKELEDLKNIQRPKVVAAIAEARSHGDLKENAEYHAAKEQQSHIEGRILEINNSWLVDGIIESNLILHLDASNTNSLNENDLSTWSDLSSSNNDVSLVTGKK